MDDLLRIEDLRVTYRQRDRTVKAVDGVSLSLAHGRTLALVGESGCGKTTTALATLNLVAPPGRIESGRVIFAGHDVLRLHGEALRALRGREISMIFQGASSGLNPVMSIGAQVAEMVRTHQRVSRAEAKRIALDALRQQQFAEPERVAAAYPFQLSGGMAQGS
ncbi:MAG TPA: ATP-binding cassette domain-containing protein [Dehalococcoidia bacterium]|nr:ATP-binding cassette domain-containing protein [Dehalococcoidia bacterium]